MKGFAKLATSNPCGHVLSQRRSSVCGAALSRASCVHLSTTTTTRRLSVDHLSPTTTTTTTRHLSVDLSSATTARRLSVDQFGNNAQGVKYIPRRASWNPDTQTTRRNSGAPTFAFPREITWLAGAPGAGKGTNSSHIAQARGYQAPTIVMSSLLENPECKRIKDAGGMVDDETVQRALLKELAKPEYRDGVVVDGFPRTEKQAQWLHSLHQTMSTSTSKPNFNFVMLFIDEEASVSRQLSRGEVIRKLNLVRSASGMEPLEERATDTSDVHARVRYANFVQQYEAINKLSDHFPLSVVDASAPIEIVRQRISSTLKVSTPQTTLSPLQESFDYSNLKVHQHHQQPQQSNSYAYL